MGQNPEPLFNLGFNLLIEVSTASVFVDSSKTAARKSISVMAHFDTGARTTTLSDSLASYLQLMPIGKNQIHTANGTAITNNYAVDIVFLNSLLKPFQNLQVSSCNLGQFNIEECLKNPSRPDNFGVLIGRDIMSRWQITWYGPTSTVFVSD